MSKQERTTSLYLRVSTNQQSTRSQRPDLERWLKAQDPDDLGRVAWFEDKATGKNMDRPGWQRLQAQIDAGQIGRLVVWRLDRLGRTAAGLCKLFERLQEKKTRLVSLRDAVDLGTPSGRLIANVLASVAAYETEVRGERVKAGQAAARADGKSWGGSKAGRLIGITPEQAALVVQMHRDGQRPAVIARSVGVNRSSVYRIVKRQRDGVLKLRA